MDFGLTAEGTLGLADLGFRLSGFAGYPYSKPKTLNHEGIGV